MADKNWVQPCQACPTIALATWRVITEESGLVYVCTPHHFILDQEKMIKWEEPSESERHKWGAEWNAENNHHDDPPPTPGGDWPNDDYEGGLFEDLT